MDTPEIVEAMSVAEAFYTEEQKRHIYESRLTALRVEREIERARVQTQQRAEAAEALLEQERKEKEAALAREAQAIREKEMLIQQLEALKKQMNKG